MDYKEFVRRITHNTNILTTAISANKPMITILPDLYTWQNNPGELHSMVLGRNLHDILPAAFIGMLANINNTGTDAYSVAEDGTITVVELKTGGINSSQIWKGKRDGLYIGSNLSKNNTNAITSYIHASYHIHSNDIKNTKRVKTILFIYDADSSDIFVDAYEMDGNMIVEHFMKKDIKSFTVKLGTFMKFGKRASTVIQLEGFESWRKRISLNAPVKTFLNPIPKNKVLTNMSPSAYMLHITELDMNSMFLHIVNAVRNKDYYVPRDFKTIGGMWTVDTWHKNGITVQLMDEGATTRIMAEGLDVSQSFDNTIEFHKGNIELLKNIATQV